MLLKLWVIQPIIRDVSYHFSFILNCFADFWCLFILIQNFIVVLFHFDLFCGPWVLDISLVDFRKLTILWVIEIICETETYVMLVVILTAILTQIYSCAIEVCERLRRGALSTQNVHWGSQACWTCGWVELLLVVV